MTLTVPGLKFQLVASLLTVMVQVNEMVSLSPGNEIISSDFCCQSCAHTWQKSDT